MEIRTKRKGTYGARILAFLLAAGGLLGIAGAVAMGAQAARQHQDARVISAVLAAILFAWCIFASFDLWRGTARGFAWAKILFALQLPVFSVARFSYEWSTFLSFRVMTGETSHWIGGNVGSSSNIYLLPQSVGFMLGINAVAVFALLYLQRLGGVRR